MTEDRKARITSVLGETAVVLGNVRGQGDLEVRGRVQGSIELRGRVHVTDSGVVLGGIEASMITVSGEVRGDLMASDGVLIEASGQVEGNIEAARVGIEAGARIRGTLRTGEPDGSLGQETPEEESIPVERGTSVDSTDEPSKTPIAKGPEEEDKVQDESPAGLKSGRTRPRKRKRSRRSPEQSAATKGPGLEPKASAGHPARTPLAEEEPGREHDRSTSGKRQETSRGERKGPPRPPTFLKGTKGHQRA